MAMAGVLEGLEGCCSEAQGLETVNNWTSARAETCWRIDGAASQGVQGSSDEGREEEIKEEVEEVEDEEECER